MPTPLDNFSYGAITLSFCHTAEFREEAQYDPSGVDLLYTDIDLTVEGVLAQGLAPAVASERPADLMQRLEHALLHPRQRLRYRLGGVTVLAIDPPDKAPLKSTPADTDVGTKQAVDVNHGPKPQSVSFFNVVEGGVGVRFRIRACMVNCHGITEAAVRRGYASNRFEQSEEFDELGYRTVRTSGLMIGRSDLKVGLDQFRWKVVPAVPQGYQRLSSRWTLSPDGLRLSYEFTDKEYYLGPPKPAKRASGRVTFVSNQTGSMWYGECRFILEGDKLTARAALASRAIKIAVGVIGRYALAGADGKPMMSQATYGFDAFENRVEVGFRITCDAKKIGGGIAGSVDLALFDPVIDGSPKENQPAIAPPIRGLFPLAEMIAAEYQDPCVAVSLQQSNPNYVSQLCPPKGTNPAFVVHGPVTIPNPTKDEGPPYDVAQISIEYEQDTGQRTLNSSVKTGTAPNETPVPHPRVKLHNPTAKMTVSWCVERSGSMPDIPDPCPGDDPALSHFVLTRMVIRAEEVTRVAGGAYRHRLAGCYWYDVTEPCKVPLVEAIPPFLVKELKGDPPLTPPVQVTLSGPTGGTVPGFPDSTAAGKIAWIQYMAGLLDKQTNPGGTAATVPPPPLPQIPPPPPAAAPDPNTPRVCDSPGLTPPPPVVPPPVPPTTPSSPGNMPTVKLSRDFVWYRLKVVKTNLIFCGDCGGGGFTGELTTGGGAAGPKPS